MNPCFGTMRHIALNEIIGINNHFSGPFIKPRGVLILQVLYLCVIKSQLVYVPRRIVMCCLAPCVMLSYTEYLLSSVSSSALTGRVYRYEWTSLTTAGGLSPRSRPNR